MDAREVDSESVPDPAQLAYRLGWDFARYGLVPPDPVMAAGHPVCEGWAAGRPLFLGRSLTPTLQVRRWLQLRLQAWQQGHRVDLMSVTPNLLAQIGTAYCPVTRRALRGTLFMPRQLTLRDATVVPVRVDRVWSAGQLVMLSAEAAQALHEASARLAAGPQRRLLTLMALVTPMSHEQALRWPLLMLPPNRLQLPNPVQGLQVLLTQQLMRSGWSQRREALSHLMGDGLGRPVLHRAFEVFFDALVLAAFSLGRPERPQRWRWALEDAWLNPRVQQTWQRFAGLMTAEQAQALVEQAIVAGLTARPMRIQGAPDASEHLAGAVPAYTATTLSGVRRLPGRPSPLRRVPTPGQEPRSSP
jgi:hypothetical protein